NGNNAQTWTNLWSKTNTRTLINYSQSNPYDWLQFYWDGNKAMDQIEMTFDEATQNASGTLPLGYPTRYIEPPAALDVTYWDGTAFVPVSGLTVTAPAAPGSGVWVMDFDPVFTSKIRVGMTNATPLSTTNGFIRVPRAVVRGWALTGGGVDRSVLRLAYAESQELTASAWTASSWAPVAAAQATAASVLGGASAGQPEVNAAAQAIDDAVAGLVARADVAGLADLVQFLANQGLAGGGSAPAGITPSSWASFAAALSAGQAALADADATQDAIDAAIDTLKSAYAALTTVVTTSLGSLVSSVQAIQGTSSQYTAPTWAKVTAAVTAAEAVLANPNASQAQVDAAAAALHAALSGLVPVPSVTPGDVSAASGKAGLSAIIDVAVALAGSTTLYTDSSRAALSAAVEAAQAVIADATAGQAQVAAATAALREAISGLAIKADTTAIASAIAAVDKLALAETGYDPATWTQFTTALAAAKAVTGNPAATQAQIDAALAELNVALASLLAHPVDTFFDVVAPTASSVGTSIKTVYVAKGQSLRIPVVAYAADGAATGKVVVSWKSSKPSVATVTKGKTSGTASLAWNKGANLTVRALKAGTSKITVTAPGAKKVTVTVKVVAKKAAVKKATITTKTRTLSAGTTLVFKAKATPAKAATVAKWTSSAPSVASVDAAGKVSAKAAGKAKITVTIGGKKSSVTLTVK
ncbi:MAG: FIVAR domain-containing protein, partial [Bifidobacteriaceae bacterium]|nr:FIVAR domain-containing protein [Bifidobacteriaceae bacterium]